MTGQASISNIKILFSNLLLKIIIYSAVDQPSIFFELSAIERSHLLCYRPTIHKTKIKFSVFTFLRSMTCRHWPEVHDLRHTFCTQKSNELLI